MRAIFIDAEHRQVSEIQIENELQAFYEKIGCEVVQIVDCGMDVDMLVDENGRLRDWKVSFHDFTKEPLPEPRQVFVPIEGELTEENINRARLIAAYLMQDFYLTARGSGWQKSLRFSEKSFRKTFHGKKKLVASGSMLW